MGSYGDGVAGLAAPMGHGWSRLGVSPKISQDQGQGVCPGCDPMSTISPEKYLHIGEPFTQGVIARLPHTL